MRASRQLIYGYIIRFRSVAPNGRNPVHNLRERLRYTQAFIVQPQAEAFLPIYKLG
jgi:hypothetical protein